MLKRSSLYTALTVAIMSTLLLMSYAVVQYAPFTDGGEAQLIRTPKLTTSVWAVFDPENGDILYGSKVDTVRPIASVTKLFTAYMIMYTGTDGSQTTITNDDVNTEGDFGKLKAGESTTLGALMFPLLIESSNDAGTAITRTLGPLYTNAAAGVISQLDLKHTHIADGTGLSKENVSSPRDLAHFFSIVRDTYPRITDITQLRMYITKARGLVNNNPLRALDRFTGGKQGYTRDAGRTFVGTFKSPRTDREVGIVLLGSTDLMRDAEEIMRSLRI